MASPVVGNSDQPNAAGVAGFGAVADGTRGDTQASAKNGVVGTNDSAGLAPVGSAERLGVAEGARRAGISRPAVWRRQQRCAEAGVDGLLRDRTGKPGEARTPEATVRRVVALSCGAPPGAATHWTGRMMAAATGLSVRAVQRIWAAHQLQPHRLRSFKRSRDPEFITKLAAIVGLYLAPPRHAVVLSVDET
jgi:hypothetical protein